MGISRCLIRELIICFKFYFYNIRKVLFNVTPSDQTRLISRSIEKVLFCLLKAISFVFKLPFWFFIESQYILTTFKSNPNKDSKFFKIIFWKTTLNQYFFVTKRPDNENILGLTRQKIFSFHFLSLHFSVFFIKTVCKYAYIFITANQDKHTYF